MDRFIERLPAVDDGDLVLCPAQGVAYQRDFSIRVAYDEAYFSKCRGYEDQAIALSINAGRIDLVARNYGRGALLDIGIGSGEFIKKRPNTFGFDVNPAAIEWLRSARLWGEPRDFSAFSFWDVIEHVEEPETYLRHVPLHGWVFVSVPLFERLGDIRRSRHYRPGEHLYYWTREGFVRWMETHGFMAVQESAFEIAAGRERIFSFAFMRYRWPRS